MKNPRIIYFTSPWLPCASFSIVNSLLEMGIKVSSYRHLHNDWIFDGKRHHVDAFKRFHQIPAFNERTTFEFRDDIHVIWGHVFPYTHLYRNKVFMITRDPRDALHHMYQWEKDSYNISYADWLRWPFHETLLDNIETWTLYHRLWEQHPELAVFRYEDNCKNSRKLMQRILDYIDVDIDEETMDRALWLSSYERHCQINDRPFNADKKRFDGWKEREGEAFEQKAIEHVAGDVMKRYRYMPVHNQQVQNVDPFPHMTLNPFFKDIPYYGEQNPVDVDTNPYLLKTFAFMRFIEKNPQHLPEPIRQRITWNELLDHYAGYLRNAMSVGLTPQLPPQSQEVRP